MFRNRIWQWCSIALSVIVLAMVVLTVAITVASAAPRKHHVEKIERVDVTPPALVCADGNLTVIAVSENGAVIWAWRGSAPCFAALAAAKGWHLP